MDQGHGDGIGGWDPGTFAGEPWGHHFGGAGIAFEQDAGADGGYPSPEFLGGAPVSHQLGAGTDVQAGLYRPFSYYDQGDVWPAHGEAPAAAYGQDASLHPAYYAEQRHPGDVSHTVESRFALDIPQGGDFPARLDGGPNQEANAHPFGSSVVNGPESAPNNYAQGSVPQWSGHVPAPYGSSQQFENPIDNTQAVHLPAPGPSRSSSSFFPGRGSEAPTVASYQTGVQQQAQANAHPVHTQFVPNLNGQRQPTQAAPAERLGPVAGSPHGAAQPPAQKAQTQQPPQQVIQQLSQQPRQAERAEQQPAAQPAADQPVFAQQSISQGQPVQQHQVLSEGRAIAGAKHARAPESEPPQGVAKKAKVLAPAAGNRASPSAQPQSEPASQPGCTVNYEDTSLLAGARGKDGAAWPGVPNLVIGPAPVQLRKGTPTKRYVTLSTKGGKDPLFPKLWRGWIPAESLGNHADAYQKATSDLDRQRADIRLKIEMNRAEAGK